MITQWFSAGECGGNGQLKLPCVHSCCIMALPALKKLADAAAFPSPVLPRKQKRVGLFHPHVSSRRRVWGAQAGKGLHSIRQLLLKPL